MERPARRRERLAVLGAPSRLSAHAGLSANLPGAEALTRLLNPDTDELRAALKLLEGAALPGVEALLDAE